MRRPRGTREAARRFQRSWRSSSLACRCYHEAAPSRFRGERLRNGRERERLSCHRGVIVPFEGNDWLASTQEPTLEPEMPICAPHHHFWDFRTTRIPYQRYLLHELAADIHGGHNLRSTVFIEARALYRAAGTEEMRPVGRGRVSQRGAAARANRL